MDALAILLQFIVWLGALAIDRIGPLHVLSGWLIIGPFVLGCVIFAALVHLLATLVRSALWYL